MLKHASLTLSSGYNIEKERGGERGEGGEERGQGNEIEERSRD